MGSFNCEKGCCKYHINAWSRPRSQFVEVNRTVFPRNRKKAGVFVYDPDTRKVLLVQSRGRLWGPPKGSMEDNETFEECGKRELMEETGMSVDDSIFNNPVTIKSNTVYFLAEIKESECYVQSNNNNDANGIGWFNVDCLQTAIQNKTLKVNQHLRLTFKKFLNIQLFKDS
jgi:8-oxo-dGTP pyrophosphatase MutT (NUDIX family)